MTILALTNRIFSSLFTLYSIIPQYPKDTRSQTRLPVSLQGLSRTQQYVFRKSNNGYKHGCVLLDTVVLGCCLAWICFGFFETVSLCVPVHPLASLWPTSPLPPLLNAVCATHLTHSRYFKKDSIYALPPSGFLIILANI